MTCQPDTGPVSLCSPSVLHEALSRLRGGRVTLMGLGLFGGGEGAARFLVNSGADLTVTDLRPEEKLGPSLRRLKGLPITYRLGQHVPRDFVETDMVVANPAVPRSSPFLRMAQRAGVPISSPVNIFLALCRAPIVAVTGSNGKSTTSALLALMLKTAGRKVWLGGNIGISLLPFVARIRARDIVVLEVSSFQLEDAGALRWSPHVAVITNLRPNHLDRHGSFEGYAAAKRVILDFQAADDVAVLNAGDSTLQRWAAEGLGARPFFFGSGPQPGGTLPGISLTGQRMIWQGDGRHEVVCCQHDVPLLGRHNLENAMAAAAAARCLGVQPECIREALSHFVGLEHRLELIGEFGGIRFYNDSYSTTPDSGLAALQSFQAPLTLIAGGYDKKLDMLPLARAAARRVEVLITLGQTGPSLAQMTRKEILSVGRSIVIREVGTLQEAVQEAVRLSMPGSVVAFSPASSSYDMFDNCTQRGEIFRELVKSNFAEPRRRSKGA